MPCFCFDDTKELRCWSMKFHMGASGGKPGEPGCTGANLEKISHTYIFPKDVGRFLPNQKLLKLLSLQTSSFSGYVASGLVSKHFSSKYDIQLPTVHSLWVNDVLFLGSGSGRSLGLPFFRIFGTHKSYWLVLLTRPMAWGLQEDMVECSIPHRLRNW